MWKPCGNASNTGEIREVQNRKPEQAKGFLAFIPLDVPGCRYPAGPDPGRTQPYLRRRIPAHDRTQPHHAAQCLIYKPAGLPLVK